MTNSTGILAGSSPSALPNPFTPMAFLPPDLAYQMTISTYIIVGTTGVIIWDILNNLKYDHIIVSKSPVKITTIMYIFSRLASLGYILAAAIFTTAPTGNCFIFGKVLGWLFTIAIPSSSLLFFFRVKAVFNANVYVIVFFAFTWLAVLAGCLTTTQGGRGAEIGPTQYCLNAGMANYTSAAVIIPVVNDTFVFLAISWRLMRNSYVEGSNLKGQVRTMVFGDYMPAFSKGFLKDGQVYYLTTVSVSLLTVAMVYVDGIPVVYRTMFTVPNVALMNIMTCRVFRNTKLGVISDNTLSTINISTTSSGNMATSPSPGPRFLSSLLEDRNGRSIPATSSLVGEGLV